MDNRAKTQFIYRLQNGINIVLLKNNYRYDESSVLECDDVTLARILHTDDGWKTINGSHVLIGKAGRIVSGAGGKFNGKRFGMNFKDYDKPKAKNGKRLIRVYKPLTKTAKHDKIDGVNLVAQKKLESLKNKLGRNENEFFKKVTGSQGFRGTPKLVGKDEFSKIAEDTGIVMYRGYSAKDAGTADGYRKGFYSGDWYTECNGGKRYGLGMYTAAAVNDFMGLPTKETQARAYLVSQRYANVISKRVESRIDCMTLVDAKIIKIKDDNDPTIEKMWMKTYQKANNCSREKAKSECDKREDKGILAAELGYDAIHVDFGYGEGFIVVLNRTKCVVYRDGADNAEIDL